MPDGWSSRPYGTPADLRLMQALSSACWRADWPAPSAHPGDLDWWSRDATDGGLPLADRIRLWFDGEPDDSDLVAWGWFNLPGDLDLMIRPDRRGPPLVRAIIEWASARAALVVNEGLPVEAVQVFVPDSQPGVVTAVEGLGLLPVAGQTLAHFTRPLDGWSIPVADLPAGFELRTLASAGDVESRVICGRAAFPSSRMTVARYEAARRTTLYRPALDWLVLAPDGRVAAFALGWLDPLTLAVELEPVGVHPDFRRLGLGRAVCLAAIRAARNLGASQGLICRRG